MNPFTRSALKWKEALLAEREYLTVLAAPPRRSVKPLRMRLERLFAEARALGAPRPVTFADHRLLESNLEFATENAEMRMANMLRKRPELASVFERAQARFADTARKRLMTGYLR